MNRYGYRLILISALLVTTGAAAGAFAADEHHDHGHADEVKLTPEAVRRGGIKIERAASQALAETFVVPARLDYDREAMAHVGAVVQGRVVAIQAKVGDAVKRGDELLVVESPELGEAQSDFLQKRTAVNVAEAAVEPLKVSYERGKALYEQNEGVALAEVQKREAEYKAAVGAVATAKAALAAAGNRLHLFGMDRSAVEALARSAEVQPRYAVRAPIDGRVIEREVTLGELVTPEDEALLVLANVEELWALADVPEARLGEVREGAAARVTLAALPERKLTGMVSLIAPAIDPATRTARVRIVLPNDSGVLRPGMFGRAEITAASATGQKATLAVPDDAVLTVEGAPAVFVPVEGEANTFAKREVEVGEAVGGMVPILAGLKEGEPYVATGSFILKAELGKGEAGHEH